jgi:uncharacterized protein (DUF362 family)
MNDNGLIAVYHTNKKIYPDMNTYFKVQRKKHQLNLLRNNKNHIYKGIESVFFQLKMDKINSKNENWNPLKELIHNGDTVLIKTNFVGLQPNYMCKNWGPIECVATHGSIIYPLIEYAYKATGDGGKIIVADAPMDITDFKDIIYQTGIESIVEYLQQKHNVPVELIDLRKKYIEKWTWIERELKGDPWGYVKIDLKNNSEFKDINGIFQGAASYGYESELPNKYHKSNHVYEIPRSVLMANCIINVPKLKTHNMAGVTLSLKNMVGISSKKNWLPHHRKGGIKDGGDEYKDKPEMLGKKDSWIHTLSKIPLGRKLLTILAYYLYSTKYKDGFKTTTIRDGEWYGNDTVWRMVLDLNKILFYCDTKGELKEKMQRKYLTIIDGIVGGEGEGPIRCVPKRCGLLIGGYNPLSVDIEATKIMGFDPKKIPMLRNGLRLKKYQFNRFKYKCIYNESIEKFKFKPPFGWMGHIEQDLFI